MLVRANSKLYMASIGGCEVRHGASHVLFNMERVMSCANHIMYPNETKTLISTFELLLYLPYIIFGHEIIETHQIMNRLECLPSLSVILDSGLTAFSLMLLHAGTQTVGDYEPRAVHRHISSSTY